MDYEFRYAINSYLASASNDSPKIPRSLTEIIEFNERHGEEALKYGQSNLIVANNKPDNWMDHTDYMAALNERKGAIVSLDRYFNKHKIDVLLMISVHYGIAAVTGFPSCRVLRTKKELEFGA